MTNVFDLDEYVRTLAGKVLAAESEQAFRRGYFSGVWDTREAIERGVSPQRLANWYYGDLWNWRHEHCPTGDHTETPPKPPQPRRRKCGIE